MEMAGVVPPDDTTGAVPVTEVTVPEPLLLNVFQSVLDKYPLLAVPAWVIANVPAEYVNGALIVAAASAVPLPYMMPEMLVVSVRVGVAPPLDVPANPLLDATATEVT